MKQCSFCKVGIKGLINIKVFELDGTDLYRKNWKMCEGCREGIPGKKFEQFMLEMIDLIE